MLKLIKYEMVFVETGDSISRTQTVEFKVSNKDNNIGLNLIMTQLNPTKG